MTVAADHIHIEFTERVGREPDGLIWMVALHSPIVGGVLFALNRVTDELEELRPYRFGMLRER